MAQVNDLIVLLVIAAFFGVCVAYIRWCDRIIGTGTDAGLASDELADAAAAPGAER